MLSSGRGAYTVRGGVAKKKEGSRRWKFSLVRNIGASGHWAAQFKGVPMEYNESQSVKKNENPDILESARAERYGR